MKSFKDFIKESQEYVGYEVIEVVRDKEESLKVMQTYLKGTRGGIFSNRKIHRAMVTLKESEAMMRNQKMIAIPTSYSKDNPKYEIKIPANNIILQ